MKFVIATEELNYLISKCLNVVSQKAPTPVLSNILLEAKKGELIVTATDLTVGIRCFTEAKIIEEGSTTLPLKKLAQLIRELTAANIEVTTDENHVTVIVAGSSKFKLHGMESTDFPELPEVGDAVRFTVKQGELRDMFFRTSFAVSREDTRYALTGVFLGIKEGKACFIGTDGKRLAKNQLPLNLDLSYSGEFIIPLKAVEEIQKNLEESDSDCTVYLMNDKIAIETQNSLTITKLLSGEYPDVTRVIPEESEKQVPLHREELMTLLRQVSLFTTEANHSVKFTFVPGELHLAANTLEIGEGRVSMPANYNGEQLEIAFNPNFFIDILRHTTNETITLGITDPYNPGIITEPQDANEDEKSQKNSSLFVLMPMRLNRD